MNNYQKKFNEEMTLLEKECKGKTKDEQPIVLQFKEEINLILEKIGKQGHSGGSIGYYAGLISQCVKKAILMEAIAPVYGTPDEWGEWTFWDSCQNKRCSGLFKDKDNKENPYYIDAIHWKDSRDGGFTGSVDEISSFGIIKGFPFHPRTFDIDVVKEQLPEDWTEAPFAQGSDYHIDGELDKNGEKIWHKNNYRYHVKYPDQLIPVCEYYDMPFTIVNNKIVYNEGYLEAQAKEREDREIQREIHRSEEKTIEENSGVPMDDCNCGDCC